MKSGILVRNLMLSIVMAAPAFAAFTEFTGGTAQSDWYTTYSNIVTFDGIADTMCTGPTNSESCNNGLTFGGVSFIGFNGSDFTKNSQLQLYSELETWYNYGRSDQFGNVISNPGILLSDSSNGGASSPVGFRITLPSPVTAFGVQVMGTPSLGGYHVSLSVSGGDTSTVGSDVPAATLTTASSHGRTFIGFTSDTSFTVIDIVGSPGITGERLVIDNVSYGNVPPPSPPETPELQSVFYMLTGFAAMFFGYRRRMAL